MKSVVIVALPPHWACGSYGLGSTPANEKNLGPPGTS